MSKSPPALLFMLYGVFFFFFLSSRGEFYQLLKLYKLTFGRLRQTSVRIMSNVQNMGTTGVGRTAGDVCLCVSRIRQVATVSAE